jgi:hypothetical protein
MATSVPEFFFGELRRIVFVAVGGTRSSSCCNHRGSRLDVDGSSSSSGGSGSGSSSGC